jgi:hypothetical protein
MNRLARGGTIGCLPTVALDCQVRPSWLVSVNGVTVVVLPESAGTVASVSGQHQRRAGPNVRARQTEGGQALGRIGVALVTGVSGHAAGVMADRLRAGGFEVRALVRAPDQARAAAQRGLVPVPGDLTAPGSLRAAVAGVSVVVHAAAYLGADQDLASQVNVAGTRQLAEASLHAGIDRFVHLSSMSVHDGRGWTAALMAPHPGRNSRPGTAGTPGSHGPKGPDRWATVLIVAG